ncbi:DUF935 family protein [Curtobacterium sp. MCSS17_007]|uniref:phage portal protein family protein n=1 Tax=Curtobacterium sp. MCSS17_007 TaxID=2175646 RepID=UPI000DAA5D54|nr:DUF935 family protein [Curtobacterium sp. MCSS17_007]WIE74494.1 DUF935 family protein [Curtobacterium sp. MCSS17_007]
MATKQKPTRKDYPETGQSGTQIFNGIITNEEYNFELMGRRAPKVWEEMRRSDATVKMSLRVVKEPVKALSYHVQPASKEAKDLEVAEMITDQMFNVLRWKTTLGEILTHLEFGFAAFEKALSYGPVHGVNRVYMSKLAFRKQTSITKWEAAGKPGITQTGPGGIDISIPLEKLVVFTNEQEGDNFEGVSVLRSAYKHYYYKDKLYQIDAIGHERQGLGVVKIKHPKNAEAKQIVAAERAAEDLRASEIGHITEPDGWNIDFMDMQAKTLKESMPSIEHHDRQISVNVLAQFMNLGSTSGSGSRAVGEPQLAIFEHYVKFIADYIADTLNRYVIKDIVDRNFNVTEYPKLVAGDVDGESLTELAAALKSLVDAGMIVPTSEDEAYLRGILRLPERPEEDEAAQDDGEPASDGPDDEDAPDDEQNPTDKKASVVERARGVLASLRDKLYGKSRRDP